MTAEILPFRSLRGKCGVCGRTMKKRFVGNDPAYCSYEHGLEGQPEHARAAVSVTRGGYDAEM